MEKSRKNIPPLPPRRKEINDNPVKLCHDISRLSRAKAREANIDGVMSQPGARLVLGVLAIEDGVTQRRIVELTHLRAPTVSVILRRMESEGLVSFGENPTDKRSRFVRLTELGRRIDEQGIESIKATDTLALDGLSKPEQEQLMLLLGRIRDNLLRAFGGLGEDER